MRRGHSIFSTQSGSDGIEDSTPQDMRFFSVDSVDPVATAPGTVLQRLYFRLGHNIGVSLAFCCMGITIGRSNNE